MSRGFTFLEVLAAVTIIVVITAAAVPLAHANIDRARTSAAATYVSSRMALARFEAVKRSAFVGIQFVKVVDGYWFRTFVDGNGNGVLARDITRGIDQPLTANERLGHRFTGVEFGIHADVPNPDIDQPFDTSDPIQIGPSMLMSFNPNGSATAGTVYIQGRYGNQFAVRVLGATGRTRILSFNHADRKWTAR
jgi:prepilin-type N-terminal cleavage/methylation domain-containing protein